jgi:hypothetical protein
VVQHRPRGDEIEAAGIDRAGDDVALSQLEPRRPDVDERQVEIEADRLAAGAGAEIEPLPQPTSSARAPGSTASDSMCLRCMGSSSRDINASRERSPSR